MINIIKQNDNITTYVTEFIADTDADVAELPTTGVAAGSTCIVAATATVYIFNNEKIWVKLG